MLAICRSAIVGGRAAGIARPDDVQARTGRLAAQDGRRGRDHDGQRRDHAAAFWQSRMTSASTANEVRSSTGRSPVSMRETVV